MVASIWAPNVDSISQIAIDSNIQMTNNNLKKAFTNHYSEKTKPNTEKKMAQTQPEERIKEETSPKKEMMMMKETPKPSSSTSNGNSSKNNGTFKFNAQAPEFVPRSHPNSHQMPMSATGFFYPYFHYIGAGGGSDWFFVGDQDPASTFFISNSPNIALPNPSQKIVNVLTDDLRQKIIKQVEYQFSDMSLLANESMSKHISKDPEGYVPISVIASTKKMKSLISNNSLLSQALLSSSKLVVSEDGKKVKRKIPFTEKEREELQSRTVVVENLPDDHSHQNLEKIFSVVGSVKTIRICQPQESYSSRPKTDFFISNKLHALVEFENPETTDKAVEKLNDERNWRKGLRVRLLLRCSPKSVLKSRKSDFDNYLDEEEAIAAESNEDSTHSTNAESANDNNEENIGPSKKGWGGRGRGKGRGRGSQSHNGRGLLSAPPQSNSPTTANSEKSAFKGPRMPDGTRGFAMGRGKPLLD